MLVSNPQVFKVPWNASVTKVLNSVPTKIITFLRES